MKSQCQPPRLPFATSSICHVFRCYCVLCTLAIFNSFSQPSSRRLAADSQASLVRTLRVKCTCSKKDPSSALQWHEWSICSESSSVLLGRCGSNFSCVSGLVLAVKMSICALWFLLSLFCLSRVVVAKHGDHRGDVQGGQEGGFGLFSGRSSLRKCLFRPVNGACTSFSTEPEAVWLW